LGLYGFLIGFLFGFFLYFFFRGKFYKTKLDSVKKEAEQILADAVKNAETKKRDMILQGKEEVIKFKTESDRELSEQRKEYAKRENKIQEREETLEKRAIALDSKYEVAANKTKLIQEKLEEVEKLKCEHIKALEKTSKLSREHAKNLLLENLDNELVGEKAAKIKRAEIEIKETADQKACEIISIAMQRLAANHVSGTTVSVIDLPNDEMKGRVIGRDGRNIRAIESLTGVDLIVDDTPGTITLSTFDPVRREIARITLEKLIADGRIHPVKIEEMFEKTKSEIEEAIKSEGERAILETRVLSVHPEIVRLLGKLHYRVSYGQSVLVHSLEVSFLCGMMASELGIDANLARRAGLLHDIGKAMSQTAEGSHVELGIEIAKKYKENTKLIHAIAAHHGDVEPKTALAFIVQAADAVSAARPGARRENIENYIKRLKKLEELASSFEGVESCYAIQAGREIRIMVDPKAVKDEFMPLLAREICKKVESDLTFPGQIKVNILRESCVIEHAK
jgi:ribonuclease Y